jgi:hypothetical protein
MSIFVALWRRLMGSKSRGRYPASATRAVDDMSGTHFECFAVAGDFPDHEPMQSVERVSDDGMGSISVTPITWRELLQRAESYAGIGLLGAREPERIEVNPKTLFEDDSQEEGEDSAEGRTKEGLAAEADVFPGLVGVANRAGSELARSDAGVAEIAA